MKGSDELLRLELDPQDVDLWLAPLDPLATLSQAMTKTLSADEAERADRFHSAQDRARFIASHSILRDLLSRYLGCAPAEIRFAYQSSGKPRLEHTECTTGDLRFNLSHCATAALYAFSWGKEVGVDIELIQSGISWERIARRFFTAREIAKLQRWPAHRRTAAFFTCWTRKEAYLKARGGGLSIPLDSFEVSAAPCEVPALLDAPDPNELKKWTLCDVPLGQSLAGAVANESCPRRLWLLNYCSVFSAQ
jgi:4'-phosphopantetheinyl transferase